jgi:hypothetical protein
MDGVDVDIDEILLFVVGLVGRRKMEVSRPPI